MPRTPMMELSTYSAVDTFEEEAAEDLLGLDRSASDHFTSTLQHSVGCFRILFSARLSVGVNFCYANVFCFSL